MLKYLNKKVKKIFYNNKEIKYIKTKVNNQMKIVYDYLTVNFERLNYIESSGGAYINISDFYATNNTRIITYFEGLSNTMLTWGFGARRASVNNEFGFFATSGYTDSYGNNRLKLNNVELIDGILLDKNKNVTTINNTYTLTHTENTFTNNVTLNIFALNNNGTQGIAPTSLKLYYFKIYENDILLYDLIPVKRKTDNAYGLYDLINNNFYGNSGNGTIGGA